MKRERRCAGTAAVGALRGALVAVLLHAAALPAADPPAQLERVMAELARGGASSVPFREVKSIALLKQPIESRGVLAYAPPDRLEKHTTAPQEERLVVERDTVLVERPARNERVAIRLDDYPPVRAFVESIRGTLAGDLAGLRRHYRVEIGGTAGAWRLHLLPRDPDMAALVRKVEIGGGGGRVSQVEIFEASGDRTVMTIEKGGG